MQFENDALAIANDLRPTPGKDGFTKIPNRFFKEFLCYMKPAEVALLLVILHRSNFHPEREILSPACNLYQQAGISPDSFHSALWKLTEAEMVNATIQKKQYVIIRKPETSWRVEAFKDRKGNKNKNHLRLLPVDLFSTGLDVDNT